MVWLDLTGLPFARVRSLPLLSLEVQLKTPDISRFTILHFTTLVFSLRPTVRYAVPLHFFLLFFSSLLSFQLYSTSIRSLPVSKYQHWHLLVRRIEP